MSSVEFPSDDLNLLQVVVMHRDWLFPAVHFVNRIVEVLYQNRFHRGDIDPIDFGAMDANRLRLRKSKVSDYPPSFVLLGWEL